MANEKRIVPKASVYLGDDDVCWIVTETPSEVNQMIEENPNGMIKLTLGNHSEWGGKPLYLRANVITAISPPKDPDAIYTED